MAMSSFRAALFRARLAAKLSIEVATPAGHMLPFEVLLFVVRLCIALIFVYFFACAGIISGCAIWAHLGLHPASSASFLGPTLIAAEFEAAPSYWLPLAFFGWVGALLLMVVGRKPAPPHWKERDADSDVACQIQALLPTNDAKPEVIVADYGSPFLPLQGLESRAGRTVVIPGQYAMEATPAEMVALPRDKSLGLDRCCGTDFQPPPR
jgi:hypothetical protein